LCGGGQRGGVQAISREPSVINRGHAAFDVGGKAVVQRVTDFAAQGKTGGQHGLARQLEVV